MNTFLTVLLLGSALSAQSNSKSADRTEPWVKSVDAQPADQRPAEWAQTKALMRRRPPAVGEMAPDFTLPTRDGKASVTRSKFHEGRPLVLIFGSYT